MGFLELWWLVASFYVVRRIFVFLTLLPSSPSFCPRSFQFQWEKREMHLFHHLLCVFVYMTMGIDIKCEFLYLSLSYCCFCFLVEKWCPIWSNRCCHKLLFCQMVFYSLKNDMWYVKDCNACVRMSCNGFNIEGR